MYRPLKAHVFFTKRGGNTSFPLSVKDNCYCSRYAQTVTDFADASHAESAKSHSHYVILRNFQFRKFLPRTVTDNSIIA